MDFIIPGRKAPVIYESCLASTSASLKEPAYENAPEGTALIAGRQTGGRGRLGRGFESPPEGLYLSMLLRPHCKAESLTGLSPMAAVAVCRAVSACAGVKPLIKWPNDVLLGGKKLCGILAESSVSPKGGIKLILGIGINVNTVEADFSPELRGRVCSLLTETGRVTQKAELAAALIGELDRLYREWQEDESACLEEYRRLCGIAGRELLLLQNGKSRRAVALGIDRDFSLKVRTETGEENIRFGEVSIRGIEGYF